MIYELQKRAVYQSPLRLLIIVVVTIFIAETATMFSLKFVSLPAWVESFVDSVSLIIVIFPVLYLLVYRPMGTYISKLKKAEEELKENAEKNKKSREEALTAKEFFESIITHVQESFYVCDGSMNITYFSPNCKELYGYTPDEFYKEPELWIKAIHPDDAGIVDAIFQDILAGKKYQVEYRIISRDGVLKWVHDMGTPVLETDGKLKALHGTIVDITERKRIDEALKASEERFRTVTEFAGDAIIGLKSPGIVCLWNKRAEEIFGYTTDEAMGKNMHDLIVPERYREKALEGLKLFFMTGTGAVIGKAIEIEALRRNGEEFPVELSISAVNMEGEWRAIGIVRDVTERRQLQENIERSNKELQDFAYIVSHDLKAPLRAIGTITSWLAEDYKDKLDDAGREQLDLLLNRTQRMHGMIEGILHYSRAGRVMGEPVRVETQKIVKDVISALCPPAGIRITIHESMPTVFIDPLKISQVFQNLISNAVKYMDKPEGLIEVGCKDAGEFWEFHVKDNGPGIEERHFERIFQIFQTLKPRDEFESTGIGLTIVKKIVEQSGGRIWVESEVGKGSTFKFTIPKIVGG